LSEVNALYAIFGQFIVFVITLADRHIVHV